MDKASMHSDIQDLYPTRLDSETLTERSAKIVHGLPGSGELDLALSDLMTFEEKGYLVIEEMFSPKECKALLDEFKEIGKRRLKKTSEQFIYEPEAQELRSIFSPNIFSPLFDRLSREERILAKVEQILGSKAYLMHSRVNIKPGFEGKSFNWHSDFETWHAEDGIPEPRLVTAWVMLTDNTHANGPLLAIPGSHKIFIGCHGATPRQNHKQSLRKQVHGVPSQSTLRRLAKQNGVDAITGAAGSLVLHECNLLHASSDNISPFARTNAMFVYNSVENLPANAPFGAENFRPEFLSSRNFDPVERTTLF